MHQLKIILLDLIDINNPEWITVSLDSWEENLWMAILFKQEESKNVLSSGFETLKLLFFFKYEAEKWKVTPRYG